VLVTPTNDFSKVLLGMNGTRNPPLASWVCLLLWTCHPIDSIKIAQGHNGVASRFQL
jgi:hypothetical protein